MIKSIKRKITNNRISMASNSMKKRMTKSNNTKKAQLKRESLSDTLEAERQERASKKMLNFYKIESCF